MIFRPLPGIASAAALLMVACYPHPEDPFYGGPPPHPGLYRTPGRYGHPPGEVITPAPREAELSRDVRERLPENRTTPPPRQNPPPRDTQPPRETPRETSPPRETRPLERETAPLPKPPETPKPSWPVAMKVVGREGFVISPYNKKQIDVSHLKSGDLAADPTYPPEEKKYFRVP
jgi:hypothetical protein